MDQTLVSTPSGICKMANDFFKNRSNSQVKVDCEGKIREYDQNTDIFGSYNSRGYTRTFFKPTSPTYWSRQPGR